MKMLPDELYKNEYKKFVALMSYAKSCNHISFEQILNSFQELLNIMKNLK